MECHLKQDSTQIMSFPNNSLPKQLSSSQNSKKLPSSYETLKKHFQSWPLLYSQSFEFKHLNRQQFVSFTNSSHHETVHQPLSNSFILSAQQKSLQLHSKPNQTLISSKNKKETSHLGKLFHPLFFLYFFLFSPFHPL
jgi:hypothetical protein